MGSLVGYRFQPKNEELITLLNKKMLDPDFSVQTINEVDIYNFEPHDLPRLSAIQSDELVWYFLCAPYYKYANSNRANRRTNSGYWKLTGKGCKIFAKGSKELIGSKRFLTFCEYDDAFKKHKAEWVMHEFRSQYNPPHEKDFVICRIERKPIKKSKISTGDDGQSNHHLASNFRNHAAENNFSRDQTQQLADHHHMTHDFRNHVAENTFSRGEPQQLPSHYLQFDSRNHVAEKTLQGVEREELADMISNHRNHVAENVLLMEQLQLLPNQNLAPNSRNHVAEKIFSGVEYQLPSQNLTSDYRSYVVENTLPRVDCQQLPAHHVISTLSNYVAENTLPRDESQLLPSYRLVSHPRNHVAENTFALVESQQLPSHHLISDFGDQVAEHSFSGVEALLLGGFDALSSCNGLHYSSFPPLQSPIEVDDVGFSACNWLDHNSFSAQQLAINPERLSASYSSGFNNDCNVLHFQFESGQEDVNLRGAVSDKYPLEENGQTISHGVNSSKSVTEAHFGYSSDKDTQTVSTCADGYSPIPAGDYYFNSMYESVGYCY